MYYVEQITYLVDVDAIDVFLEADHRIWDAWLQAQPGLIQKDIWYRLLYTGVVEIKIIVTWKSEEAVGAIDSDEAADADKRFFEALSGYYCQRLDQMNSQYSGITMIAARETLEDDDSLSEQPEMMLVQ